MVVIISLLWLIVFILGISIISKLNISSKKNVMTIFIVVWCSISICSAMFLIKPKNTDEIKQGWIMEIEKTDGFSNIIYIYEDNKMVIEYNPKEFYPSKEKKIDSKVNVQKVYEYIKNSNVSHNGDYKVTINDNGNKITKYVSTDMGEIADFIELINQDLSVQLK